MRVRAALATAGVAVAVFGVAESALAAPPTPLDPQNDFGLLVHENAITVTPLMLQHTHHELVGRLDGVVGI